MPSVVRGQETTVGTQQVLQARRVVDMADRIFLLEPSKSPLTLFITRMGKKAAINPEFKWPEDELIPRVTLINGTFGIGVNPITVDEGRYVPVNSEIRNQRTGETMHVTAVSGNNLTVVHSWGTTADAGQADNDPIQILGGMAMEGTASEAGLITTQVEMSNFIQIFKTPFELSEVHMASDMYGGPDFPYQSKKKGIEHAVYIETAFFFGEKNQDSSGVGGRWSTGGVDEFATQNRRDFGGSVASLADLYDWAEDVFRYGNPMTKVLFCSRAVSSNISLLAANVLRTESSDRTFGISISSLLTPHGTLRIVTHNAFEGTVYGERAYLVDMENCTYRYLTGLDTKLHTNIQAPDVAARKDEYRSYCGLMIAQPKTHGVMLNAATV